MQLLTIVWVSSLWAILACGLMFHAEYVVRVARYYVAYEEREMALQAAMRAACIQYQLDALLPKKIADGKSVVLRWQLSRPTLGINDTGETTYTSLPQGGLEIRSVLERDGSVWGVVSHRFSAATLALAKRS